ncbi:DUF5615 family PIN-like protein [Desulfoscipio geothermicus]|uniref:Predicted nuclease, contains PIN domain, potential toxin-antitoxin system component n=1 Tax=Desulfoscipio geothermicus DSM 3669 TaxID=1121426 RepID=A0A1I6E9X7_9FIRM|nr:DUF5615 family PIN-like protein [Desulfoscipio geothermicus]SFR14563.1 Predicted nuclease, contains PIN domain, potential toxin-antitoxin system component [Desulfoscipio geothermicus DSM 3669]
MRIKIDENMPVDVIDVFENTGHEAHSVYSEGIEGCSDRQLIAICKKEQRVLITLDNDFSNIFAYPPEKFKGIIVLRVENQSKRAVITLVNKLLPVLASSEEKICGNLWIVEENRIRIRGIGS